MSKDDITIMDNEIIDDTEEHITDNQVYKNLHQRSASLACILIIFLPILLFLFNVACTSQRTIVESLRVLHDMFEFDLDSFAIVLGWLVIQSIFFLPVRNGVHLQSNMIFYRRNGIVAFILSLGGVYLLNSLKMIRASYVYDNINKILIASIVISSFISFLIFIKGTRTRHLKNINTIVAFFYGTDINLTISGMNLKLFFELRAGLIGWACLNLCFFLKTIELYPYRRLSPFLLVAIQQILHALQLVWYEDHHRVYDNRKKETIGFIRVFGSLCWFPFLWCSSCQYLTLVNYPIRKFYIIGSILLFVIGMIMYQASHNHKEVSKKSCKNISKSTTCHNGLISLTSSYCYLYRHPYYLDYLLMLISWSLPCGPISITWMLPIYYLLVIHHVKSLEAPVSH